MRDRTTTTLLMTILIVACGCSGDGDPLAPAAEIDLSPPAPPANVTAVGAAGVVKLGWEPNRTDPDLAGYHVYLLLEDRSLPLTGDPLNAESFIDASPLEGNSRYAVTSVDLHGNESAWSCVVHLGRSRSPQRSS
ncbi:MAG: hypothetical protein AB7V45_08180 [Candidatus Krumholzibacteriia bacterium]